MGASKFHPDWCELYSYSRWNGRDRFLDAGWFFVILFGGSIRNFGNDIKIYFLLFLHSDLWLSFIVPYSRLGAEKKGNEIMIGVYDYTVVLTYISLLSACTGIFVSLSGTGHPYIGSIFLMFCGFCDAFDGKIARTKKNRTSMERQYGIQIDSLSDLVAFGILPTCIGTALIRVSPMLQGVFDGPTAYWKILFIKFGLHSVLVLYALAAMIRLAYFNVTEEERQKTEKGARKIYIGLPVTSAALIFPFVLLIQYIITQDVTVFYLVAALITGGLFLSKLHIKKFGTVGILVLIGIGLVECLIMIFWKVMHSFV